MTKPTVLFIIGQTAVGKSALALNVAAQHNGEIISADSRQIYRQMDIGTAKPTSAELAQVPHHLIDVVAPDQVFTLAQYRDAALSQITAIAARERLPMVVGGTGQYLAALLEGWTIPELPPNAPLRAELAARAARDGGADLYAQLQTLDPVAAATIHATNVRRVMRALEVCLITGQLFSQLRQVQELTFAPRVVWLTSDTPALYARIDQRVDVMMQAGLLAEVESLRAAGYGWELPAMSGIGYREFMPYFAGESPLADVVERIKFDTHAFARRQATWFRRFDTHQTTSIDEDAIRRIINAS